MVQTSIINTTIVCVIDGQIYQKTCATSEEVLRIYSVAINTDEDDEEDLEELLELLLNDETVQKLKEAKEEYEARKKEIEENAELLNWIEEINLKGHDQLEVKNASLYVKGISISIPMKLIPEFKKRNNDEKDFNALLNFWRRAALNPDARCREDLFNFIVKNGITLTESGLFIAYRNARIKKEGPEYEKERIILKGYYKARKKGRDLSEYGLYRDSLGVFFYKRKSKMEGSTSSFLGDLNTMYTELMSTPVEERTVYTDQYSGTTTIVIGTPVSIPRSECNSNPEQTCSKGLHVASSHWLTKNYFGEQGLVVLVDPRDAISVPYEDHGKMRCCRYLPIALAEYGENGYIIPVETSTYDCSYSELLTEELVDMIKSANIEEYKQHAVIPLEISLESLKNIKNSFDVNNLHLYKDTIKSRVKRSV